MRVPRLRRNRLSAGHRELHRAPAQRNAVRRARAAACPVALQLLVALQLVACAALEPAAAAVAPVLRADAGEGARWVSLGLHPGPDGEVLAGRFSVLSAPFLASRSVLVQGRDATGTLLFEELALGVSTTAANARNHRERVLGFSFRVPDAPGLTGITVTVPRRSAD